MILNLLVALAMQAGQTPPRGDEWVAAVFRSESARKVLFGYSEEARSEKARSDLQAKPARSAPAYSESRGSSPATDLAHPARASDFGDGESHVAAGDLAAFKAVDEPSRLMMQSR